MSSRAAGIVEDMLNLALPLIFLFEIMVVENWLCG